MIENIELNYRVSPNHITNLAMVLTTALLNATIGFNDEITNRCLAVWKS